MRDDSGSQNTNVTQAYKTLQWRYTTVAGGDASFFRDVSIPLTRALADYLPSNRLQKHDGDLDESLAVSKHARNDLTLIAGMVGVFLFGVGTHIGKKILDDVYTAKIQPRVKEILGRSDASLVGAQARKKKL